MRRSAPTPPPPPPGPDTRNVDVTLSELLTTLREEKVVKAIRAEPDHNVQILYGQVHIGYIRSMLMDGDAQWRTVSSKAVPF